MKKIITATVAAFSLTALQAFAGSPVQVWKCQINDDMGEEELIEFSGEWAKAAAKVDGGKNMSNQVLPGSCRRGRKRYRPAVHLILAQLRRVRQVLGRLSRLGCGSNGGRCHVLPRQPALGRHVHQVRIPYI